MPFVAVNKDGLFWSSWSGTDWDEECQSHLTKDVELANELNLELKSVWDKRIQPLIDRGVLALVPDPRLKFVGVNQGIAVYEDGVGNRLLKETLFEHPEQSEEGGGEIFTMTV